MTTKQKIINQAIESYNTYGLTNITSRDIAKLLNISPGNLDYHFKNKEALLKAIYEQLPKKIENGKYINISSEIETISKANNLGKPIRNYTLEGPKHYHQFIDACLGKDICSAPFSYAARLTETILLGVIAGRFPNKILHWDNKNAKFAEEEANKFLQANYRKF